MDIKEFYRYLKTEWIDESENISILKQITNHRIETHSHDFIEISYVKNGSAVHSINEIDYSVKKGDLLFFNFNDIHSVIPENDYEVINCLLPPGFVSRELVNSQNAMDILTSAAFNDFFSAVHEIDYIIHLKGKDLINVENIFDIMIQEFKEKKPGYLTVLNGYVNILLATIFRVKIQENGSEMYSYMNQIAPDVLKYIEDNFQRKLSLTELASMSFINSSYFSRLFKNCFGKSLTAYVSEKRFNLAIELLKQSNKPIDVISLEVGYKHKKQLYKLFKDFANTTPEKYRKEMQKKGWS